MDKILAEAKEGTYKGRPIIKMDKADLIKALYIEAGDKVYVDPEKKKWIDLEKRLKELRTESAKDFSASGQEYLIKTVNPLLIRYINNERTEVLYEEIMELF